MSPGELYGPDGGGHVRVAVVQPMDRLELVGDRLRTDACGFDGRDRRRQPSGVTTSTGEPGGRAGPGGR